MAVGATSFSTAAETRDGAWAQPKCTLEAIRAYEGPLCFAFSKKGAALMGQRRKTANRYDNFPPVLCSQNNLEQENRSCSTVLSLLGENGEQLEDPTFLSAEPLKFQGLLASLHC